MSRSAVAGLVLAAGDSSRMGPAANKLTEPVAGEPMVVWPVDALLEAGVDPVFVVTGHQAEAVREALAGRRCRFVHHDAWAQGMGASLAHGARSLDGSTLRGVMVCLGDLPGLRAGLVEPLLRAFDRVGSPEAICVPVHRGRRGHPVLFGIGHLPELARVAGEEGARALLRRCAEQVVEVEVGDDGILADVDTPEALAAWRARPATRPAS